MFGFDRERAHPTESVMAVTVCEHHEVKIRTVTKILEPTWKHITRISESEKTESQLWLHTRIQAGISSYHHHFLPKSKTSASTIGLVLHIRTAYVLFGVYESNTNTHSIFKAESQCLLFRLLFVYLVYIVLMTWLYTMYVLQALMCFRLLCFARQRFLSFLYCVRWCVQKIDPCTHFQCAREDCYC